MSKKEQVIEAACTLFSTYGYRKVSMDEIAKKSAVTKKTIYTYFKDKDDLIKYFLNEELCKMKQIVTEVEKQNLPYNEKINKTIMELFDYRKDSKLLQAFANENTYEYEGIFNETVQDEIKILLEKGIKEGRVKRCDTEIVSFIIYKIYVALMFDWNKPLDKKKAAENIMDFLNSGLFN